MRLNKDRDRFLVSRFVYCVFGDPAAVTISMWLAGRTDVICHKLTHITCARNADFVYQRDSVIFHGKQSSWSGDMVVVIPIEPPCVNETYLYLDIRCIRKRRGRRHGVMQLKMNSDRIWRG